MKRHLVLTVDCDLRSDAVSTRQETLDLLLGVFEDTGAAGHTTWFLNENDFFITENHESFLREAARRGDTIGVHDHVDFLGGKRREEALFTHFGRSLRAVRKWLAASGGQADVPFHRMGCLYQREECYRALARLGYRVLSDAFPGQKRPDHAGDVAQDNREIPAPCRPYRHDPPNFADWRSTTGRFLQFPVFHMFLDDLDFERVKKWIAAGESSGYEHLPFVWCFHPYELCHREADGARNVIDPEATDELRENIRRLRDAAGLRPANLEACRQIHGG